ncbi:hypothetical protein [Streptomyces sp. NPDC020996]|uniref:hypothetical protein n=1 Tax=Streptomyces sp. NPDC020996 TaxID=3154791 RepID=UPI0033C787E2
MNGALTAPAAAVTLGYGWKGAPAACPPGGMDASGFDREGLYALFMLNDFGSFAGWRS